MRSFVAITGLLAFSSTCLYAGPSLGLKAGMNLANVRVTTPVDVEESTYGTRSGLIAGVFAEMPVVSIPNLNVRGELLYVQKGTVVGFLGERSTVEVDEITFAPYAVYYLLGSVPFRPFVEIGPELGVNVADKTVSEFGNSFDSSGSWNSTDFSMNVGGGIRIPFGTRFLTVEGRYSDGLKNMGTWIPHYVHGTKTWTHGVQLMIGYAFFNLL